MKRILHFVIVIPMLFTAFVARADYSFSMTLSVSGCGDLDGRVAEATFKAYMEHYLNKSMGIPDRATCEQLRNHIMDYAQFHQGGCTVRVICSPCTGSGGAIGSVDVLGVSKGNSFYSTNGANEIRDWSNDDMERMLALNPDFSYTTSELSMGTLETDRIRSQARDEAFFRPINASDDEKLLPYTDAISMAQTHILELAGMTSSELHEKLSIVNEYITAEYNQRILELNKQILICEMKTECAFINALCNKNMPESARKEYEAKIEKIKNELINEYGVSLEDITRIQEDSKSFLTETVKLLDDYRDIPQGYDLNAFTEALAGLKDSHKLSEIADLQKEFEIERNALNFNYNNDVNKLRNVDDLLKIQQGMVENEKVSFGKISQERAYDVMEWYGDNGKDISTLFPKKFVNMFIKKDTKIEIK